jgi:hypothetical protein
MMDFSEDLIEKRGSVEACTAEFESMDPGIKAIVGRIDALASALFGKQALITSMIRAGAGTHSSKRCVDIDVDEKSQYGGILPAEARLIREIVNEALVYDASRPHFAVVVYGENDP